MIHGKVKNTKPQLGYILCGMDWFTDIFIHAHLDWFFNP